MTVSFSLDGEEQSVDAVGWSLLDALRSLGVTSVKDGCSPQGQCGCCTVLVDGAPRVACVTPLRRVAGRRITTVDGLEGGWAQRWAESFCSTGGSQCGFCTPGIVLRLEALRRKGVAADDRGAVHQALLAHLCRCTGWQTIGEAWSVAIADGQPVELNPRGGRRRDLAAASRRAEIEGRVPQRVAPDVALGRGGFADDHAPPDALVAVTDGRGGWVLGESLSEARAKAAKVQGRNSTLSPTPPVPLPDGSWDRTLQTSWVEPAYLETDASWCRPGGEPASPLGNGGAFGGKSSSPVADAARRLADSTGRAVRVLYAREDTARLGPKRPPIAAGLHVADRRVTVAAPPVPGLAAAIAHGLGPNASLEMQAVALPGPPTSLALRAAGFAEGVALRHALDCLGDASIEPPTAAARLPSGGEARVELAPGGAITIWVRCGDPLDEVVLRSYCIGAAHMALSWVTSEGLTVDPSGEVVGLTVRSFGVRRALETPPIEVVIDTASPGPPTNGSDAVFAAVAAAAWGFGGFAPSWPSGVLVG